MSKVLLQNVLVFVLTFLVVLAAHSFFLNTQEITVPYSLSHIYVFHALASLLICGILFKLKTKERYVDELGFVYLLSVAVKAILFLVLFNAFIFDQNSLTNIQAISLLLPLFLGLFFEVFFLSKLLKKTPKIKNE